MPQDHDLVDKHWPHVAALSRLLEALDGRTVVIPIQPSEMAATPTPPSAPTSNLDGQEIVRLIRLYENASGASWRS